MSFPQIGVSGMERRDRLCLAGRWQSTDFSDFFSRARSISTISIARITRPPNIRLSMVLTSVVVEFLKRKGLKELIPQLEPIIGEVMRTVETGQALITSAQLNLSGVQQTLDPRANKHLGRLLDHWKILLPELVPLNRGGRLADQNTPQLTSEFFVP